MTSYQKNKIKVWFNVYHALIFLLLITFNLSAIAQEIPEEISLPNTNKKKITGFVDINGYYDTRSFDVLTVNTLVNLPFRLQYFSFINLFGNSGRADQFSLNKYYTEQNLYFSPYLNLPIDINGQWAFATGFTDVIRIGPRWRVQDTPHLKKIFKKLNLIYLPAFFPLQYDRSKGYDALIEHFYRVQLFPKLFGDRLYSSGFADHNLLFGSDNKKNHNVFVVETQIGFRLVKRLYIVCEYRYNEFYSKKKHGLGIGLEYDFKF